MKPICALSWLLVFAHSPLGSAVGISNNTLNPPGATSFDSVDSVPESPDAQEKPPIIIHRCRAEELSPGSALAIIIVLATASAIHMPGSLLVPRRPRFYRLAPELGLADTAMTVVLILQALFVYRKTLRQSVTAVLLLRHHRADQDLWWQSKALYTTSTVPNETTTSENEDSSLSNPVSSPAWRKYCLECTKPVLRRICRFGHERLLSNALVLLAAIKAFAITGSIRTTLLAASYVLSFFTMEILSFAALHIGVPPTRAEQEAQAEECAELISLLDNRGDAWKFRSSPRWETERRTWRTMVRYGLACPAYGLPAALHLIFWPFSLPLFLGFEFDETHSSNGKWSFIYLVSAKWLLWILLAGCAAAGILWLLVLVAWMAGGRVEERKKIFDERWEKVNKRVDEAFTESVWFDAYTALKVVLVVRFYVSGSYTGQDTTKPEWLEWLG